MLLTIVLLNSCNNNTNKTFQVTYVLTNHPDSLCYILLNLEQVSPVYYKVTSQEYFGDPCPIIILEAIDYNKFE